MDAFAYDLPRLRNLISPACDIHYYEKTSSTQILAKKAAVTGDKKKSVFIANEQVAGYGRFGRHFFSPVQAGIYLSVNIPIAIKENGLFTTGLAVSIANVLADFFPGKDIKLKWVNDLYYKNKKLGGLLVEKVDEMAVCGIGINLINDSFPSNLKEVATSLSGNQMVSIDRTKLVAAIINQVIHDAPDYQSGRFLSNYRQRSIILGRQIIVKVNGSLIYGVAKYIDDNGALIIYDLHTNQERKLVSGEVQKVMF